MLGKLLKQDFRATARIILPVYAAVPVLGLFTGLITRLCENQSNIWISILGSLVSFVFSLALIAAVVTTVVLMILRFYRNLMTDEGYLMFTLPVSTTELICSKLIVSVVWFLGALAVDALGLLVTGRFGSYQDAVRFQVTYTFGMPMTGAQSAGLIAETVFFLLLCCVALCLMTYAAMAIGQSFKKNKGAHVRRVLLRALDRHAAAADADLRAHLRARRTAAPGHDCDAAAQEHAHPARLCLCGRAGILCGLLLPHARHAAQAPEPAITQQKTPGIGFSNTGCLLMGSTGADHFVPKIRSPASPRPGTM